MSCFSKYAISQHHTTISGHQIHYIKAGSGAPLIFLHGNPTWSYLWRNVIHQLHNGYTCIAPDLVGFGHSDKPATPLTYQQQYKMVELLIHQLNLTPPILIGHDWGGVLATHYTHQHPDSIKGLVLMESFPFLLQNHDFPTPYRFFLKLLQIKALRKFLIGRANILLQAMPYLLLNQTDPAIMPCYRKPFLNASTAAIPALFKQLPLFHKQNQPLFTQLQTFLTCTNLPVLWLTGQPGLLNRKKRTAWLQNALSNGTVRSVGRSGHFIPEEQPKKVAKAIDRWIQDLNDNQNRG